MLVACTENEWHQTTSADNSIGSPWRLDNRHDTESQRLKTMDILREEATELVEYREGTQFHVSSAILLSTVSATRLIHKHIRQ